jgi:hypothetical protein
MLAPRTIETIYAIFSSILAATRLTGSGVCRTPRAWPAVRALVGPGGTGMTVLAARPAWRAAWHFSPVGCSDSSRHRWPPPHLTPCDTHPTAELC